MPSSRHALAREHEPHGERIRADEPQPRARAAMDLRPRAQQHVHALARLVPADEDDAVARGPRDPPAAGRARRSARPCTRRAASAAADSRACSETAIRLSMRAARRLPHVYRPYFIQREVAARVERRDGRPAPQRDGGDADRGRHRLVHVDHVEALALEDPLDAPRRRRAEHDVRQRAVRRDDHGAPDGEHVLRRIRVPAEARMQHVRERAGRIVARSRATRRRRARAARGAAARRDRRRRPRTTTSKVRRWRPSRADRISVRPDVPGLARALAGALLSVLIAAGCGREARSRSIRSRRPPTGRSTRAPGASTCRQRSPCPLLGRRRSPARESSTRRSRQWR